MTPSARPAPPVARRRAAGLSHGSPRAGRKGAACAAHLAVLARRSAVLVPRLALLAPLVALLTPLLAVLAPLPAEAGSMASFGHCLSSRGAIFYGASWCPHCSRQKDMLGDAMSGVRYVECSPRGRGAPDASACTAAGVNSYPTWVFGDGSRAGGALPLSALAAKTGCSLPGASGSAPKSGAAPRTSGPKIIEVPNRGAQ